MKDSEQPVPTTKQPKKPYEQPQLRVYGNLRDITEGVGVAGVSDNVLVLKTH